MSHLKGWNHSPTGNNAAESEGLDPPREVAMSATLEDARSRWAGWSLEEVKEAEGGQHEGSSASPKTVNSWYFLQMQEWGRPLQCGHREIQPIWEPNTHSPQLIHPNFNSLLTRISRSNSDFWFT